MTIRQKVLASISLFLVLLSGAWYANDYNQRTIHSKGYDGVENISILQAEEQFIPITAPFKPREYVRIGSRRIPAQ